MIGTSKHLEKNEQNPIKKSLFIVKGRPSQGIDCVRPPRAYVYGRGYYFAFVSKNTLQFTTQIFVKIFYVFFIARHTHGLRRAVVLAEEWL